MRDLAKSMFRLSWAMALQGADRVLHGAKPGGGPAAQLTSALQAGFGPLFKAAFQAGDALQSEWIDQVAEAFTQDSWDGALTAATELPSEALRFASPTSEGAVARQEFRNRFETYRLVANVRTWLELPPPGTPFNLRAAVEQALRLDRHRALWAMEGLGHAYGETALEYDAHPQGLLTDPCLSDLPLFSLAMLHAGIGLAFAEHLLRDLGPQAPAQQVRRRVAQFAGLCAANGRAGHEFGSHEALGLLARGFFPELVPALERALSELGDLDLQAHFWHGLGRSLYFVPINFIPGCGSIRQAIARVHREAPHDLARDNALVGLGMAFTLVNMAHPSVFENLLATALDQVDSRFCEGLVSAVVLRHDHAPDPRALEVFLRHRPPESAPELAAAWQRKIAEPCAQALAADDPELRALPPCLRLYPEDQAVPFTRGNALMKWMFDQKPPASPDPTA